MAVKITHAGELKIGDMIIPCYVTEDKQRLISSLKMQEILKIEENVKEGAKRGGTRFKRFLSRKFLKPFISNEEEGGLFSPVVGTYKGSKINGFSAEALVKLCDIMIEAKSSNILKTDRQRIISEQAQILKDVFAKVGLVALIDEATGYQEARAKNELRLLLEKYVCEEFWPWQAQFPDVFYEQICRLRGWNIDKAKNRPKVVGKWTNSVIYQRLPEGVLQELRSKNPKVNNARKHKHHQFLTDDVGNPHLRDILISSIAVMKASPNWKRFIANWNRAYPLQNNQLELFELEECDNEE